MALKAQVRVETERFAGSTDEPGIRLQRVLAQAGVGSRRACEELIAAGRVTVDGTVVRRQGVRVDPAVAEVTVDGERVVVATDRVYLAVNKPKGVVSTMSDPRGRRSLQDLLGDRNARLFHVGRLDADTEGLLLVTNDGDLAHRLMHPSFDVPKTYLATVAGPVPRGIGRQLRSGVALDDGPVRVDGFRVVSSVGGRALVEVVLHEGRNHIVRRLLAAVDLPVHALVRTRVGPVALGDLKSGRHRRLTRAEIAALFAATTAGGVRSGGPARPR